MSGKGWVAVVGGVPDSRWSGHMVWGGCWEREDTSGGVEGVVK